MWSFVLALTLACAVAKLNVHIVPHTHDDVGWLKTVDQYYSGANNTIQHAGVRYILNGVLTSLSKNPDRKFTYVEQAFFQRWWREQDDDTRTLCKNLVKSGQLNFVNGGWCMHDEAATHYIAMVDQTTLGHRLIIEEFGEEAVPNVGWQLDPFGHSATQAALLSAETGFDALFFGRIDYQDLKKRVNESRAEFIWRASPSLGADAQVFAGLTGEYGGNYGPPSGFDWDHGSADEPFEDNPDLETYNIPSRVQEFVDFAQWQGNHTRGEHVMWTMGSDFNYEAAEEWFINMDKMIKAVNADGRINAFYSSPSQYVAAKKDETKNGLVWPITQGDNADFFPYADGPHQFWTGYFTSRPALKRYVRTNSAYFNAIRQQQVLANARDPSGATGLAALQKYEEALGVAQHHDAVSGTAKQHVTFDYAKRLAGGASSVQSIQTDALNMLIGSAGNASWSQCARLNETVCAVTQAAGAFTLSVYNQLGQARSELITIPVHSADYAVTDSTGKSVPVQVAAAGETVTNYARNTNEAKFVASFQASLPPVGSATFVFKEATTVLRHHRHPIRKPDFHRVTDDTIVVENDFVSLTFSNTTGRITAMTNKKTNTNINIDQSFCYYKSNEGDKDSGQRSGAYIFRPINGSVCFPVSDTAMITDVIRGPVYTEVRQVFAPWLTQSVRLSASSRHAEFEYTVGEIPLNDDVANSTLEKCVSWRQTGNCDPNGPREPKEDKSCTTMIPSPASGYCECFGGRKASMSNCGHTPFTCEDMCKFKVGKEVVSQFTTSIKSDKKILTDSNGREMLNRERNYRPTWELSQTEAVAGNYFPCNAAAAIRDANAQLTVLVDATQGVGSIVDGQMELMVHRRILADDGRGVGEPLDETEFIGSYAGKQGGVHSGRGLVIRGSHFLTIEPPATAASVWRPLADRIFGHPLVSVAPGAIATTPSSSALQTALPSNVQLMTLQALDTNKVLLRLAHQFGIGEDATLSQPATVDLSTLFDATALKIASATEVSLTNAHSKADIMTKRQEATEWHVDAVKPQPWRSLPPLDYEADTTVTLGPLEIKTFILEISM